MKKTSTQRFNRFALSQSIPIYLAVFLLTTSLHLSARELHGRKMPAATKHAGADIRVNGRVVDSAGAGLPGVSVRVRGNSSLGTQTDVNGAFVLTVPDNATLIVSSIGYESQEIAVNSRTEITVSLQSNNQVLSQVVVVGYGTQRRIDVTGSVAQVRGEEISKQASTNAISALQGKVAGVQVTNSGAPGASPQIRIRGLGTVYGNPNPLYVVDGVWFDDISFLNPADIDNISILKDASSEAIYGIRAANGVVLVTTRKGRAGKTVVNYTGYAGLQHVTNQVKMANAKEYATLLNEKGVQTVNPANYGEGTNWFDVVLRDALITNHQISVSGGSERSTFNFSLGYLKQEGIIEKNTYSRVTARLQNDFQLSKNLRVGYTVTTAASKANDLPASIFYQAYVAPPIVPVKNANGSYGDPTQLSTGNFSNPQASLDFFNQNTRNYRFTGNVYAELKFLKNFTFRTSVGGEYGDSSIRNYAPVYFATNIQRDSVSTLTLTKSETRNYIVENTLTYDKRVNDHTVRVLLGQSAQRYQYYKGIGTAQNVPNNSEGDYYFRLGTTGTRNVVDEGDLSTIASYFGRVNYSFRNRYLLNASLRADGSSKFTGNQRWGYFPSVGAGWIISDEAFMDDQKLFRTLKLRGSWGKIGNASVPTNISTVLVNQNPAFTAIFGNQLYTGASITSIVPPVTYWERGVGTDIGLEASMLNGKLSVEADFYNRKTERAIFAVPILSSLGTSGNVLIANNADFQNQGFELSVGWRNNLSEKLSYTINGNVGINNNKVLSVATGSNPLFAGALPVGGFYTTRSVVGQPIGQFFGLISDGIYQTAAEVAASPHLASATPGSFKYRDVSGPAGKPDGAIDDKDRVILGNPNPKYTFGLNTNWTYKQFDLTVDLQGVAGVEVYNANIGIRYGNENYTKDFFDKRWHGAGTSNAYPSANLNGDNLIPNSWYVQNGDYLRIRNLQLGYNLSSAILERWNMSRFRIYVNAQNPVNFFTYKGFNPEVGGAPTYTGIDNNVYPLSATYNFGVNVTF